MAGNCATPCTTRIPPPKFSDRVDAFFTQPRGFASIESDQNFRNAVDSRRSFVARDQHLLVSLAPRKPAFARRLLQRRLAVHAALACMISSTRRASGIAFSAALASLFRCAACPSAGPMSSVISPRGGFFRTAASKSSICPRRNSSYIFVTSRAITAGRLPRISSASSSVSSRRCGAS